MMKGMVRRILLFGLLALLLMGSSCGADQEMPAGAVLSAMLAAEADCPPGRIYQNGTAEGAEGYFSESLCAALYGDGEVPAGFSCITDYAIFLSYGPAPVELAVFRVSSGTDTGTVADLCVRRMDRLCRYFRGGDLEAYPASGRILTKGNWVIFAVSSNSERAVEEALRAIRK